jgi:hypothetical protein
MLIELNEIEIKALIMVLDRVNLSFTSARYSEVAEMYPSNDITCYLPTMEHIKSLKSILNKLNK